MLIFNNFTLYFNHMHRFLSILLTSACLLTSTMQIHGQESDEKFTSFTKGRSLVALSGAISSATDNRSYISSENNVLNNYTLNAKMAKLLARNFALGLSFSTEKYNSDQVIRLDREVLYLGPWAAYYFTNGQQGGIFVQGALYFVNYYEYSQFTAINPPIEELARGKGFSGAIGFGYTYVMFDRIGLEVSMIYNQARVYGDVQNTTSFNPYTNDVFNRINILFQFGFTVLFDKIKDE